MAIPVIGKIIKGFVGSDGVLDSANVEVDNTSLIGVLSGVTESQSALNRLDGTGIGADLFTFTGAYSAQASNIDEWFGGKQLVRMRCTSRGGSPAGSLAFDLPGSTALGTAFDQLVAKGLSERLQFVIEYTGDASSFLNIRPRTSPSPQIMGTTNIIVRPGVAATLEVTRTSGTISDYLFQAITQIAQPGSSTFDALKLQNPATVVWDASTNGTLPSTGVVKGNAYKVVNAPTDGSGRFGEVMYTDDWVVWEGETFTSWTAEPHQWFVISAHDVRRITALENDFLSDVAITTPVSDRNAVIRGADYADSAGEIRIKLYDSVNDYTPADLNTTGQIDSFTQATDSTSVVAVRLPGTQSSLASTLPNLYVYEGTTLIGNIQRDFTYRGDFGSESDYVLDRTFNYVANEIIRVYQGTTVDRYNAPNLDINENNLTQEVQDKLNSSDHPGSDLTTRVLSLESKVTALFPLTPDVDKLVDFSDIYDDSNTTQTVNITDGYSLIADYRSDSERYESAGVTYDNTGTNVVTYTGLGTSYNKGFGFTISAPSNKVLLSVIDGSERIPYIDITSAGNIRVNNYTSATAPGQDIRNEAHFDSRTSGDTILTTASDSVQTFTVNNFPAGATNTSRTMQLSAEIYLNGSDTRAGSFISINAPDTNIAQAQQSVQHTADLGPLYNNRHVSITLGYTFRVSGNDLLLDVVLLSSPSDITVDITNVATYLNYTSASTTTRTDNYSNLTDAFGDYTFTGAIDLLVTFHPIGTTNLMNVVPVTINSSDVVDELNDSTVPRPPQDFASVEIPDDIDFITFQSEHYFVHSDLSALLRRRGTKWAYGLAALVEVTEQQITELIDFTQGIVLISPNSTRYTLTVADDGTLKTEVTT